jgi:two-component system sensor histidine kinase HydH
MAATIAHEVKNPLSSIKSIAQVMGEDAQLRREYGRDIDLIVGETDRLNRSVTQLLSFARPAPATERTTLDQLIRTTVDLLRAEAVAARVSVEVQPPPLIELDSRSLAAVKDTLTNLLINALHATPQGGEVRVETVIKDSTIKISITDEGPGVPPEIRARIWDPFFTTKQRGTGLGLAIAAKRMQEIGGTVQLSPPDKTNCGAQFVLTFPRPINNTHNPGTPDADIKAKAKIN